MLVRVVMLVTVVMLISVMLVAVVMLVTVRMLQFSIRYYLVTNFPQATINYYKCLQICIIHLLFQYNSVTNQSDCFIFLCLYYYIFIHVLGKFHTSSYMLPETSNSLYNL